MQAMGLSHQEGFTEVACNLLSPDISSAALVQERVEGLAKELGLEAGNGYTTGLTPQSLIDQWIKFEEESRK
jgi:hypothetical protein